MKKLLLLFVSVLLTSSLCACSGNVSETTPEVNDVTLFKSGQKVMLLVENGLTSSPEIIKLRDSIAMLGIVVDVTDDVTSDFTIAVGNTTVDASVEAANHLANQSAASDEDLAFVFKMTDGKLAICGKDKASLDAAIEYFSEHYLTSSTLKLSADFAFLHEKKAPVKVDTWETRFDDLEAKHGEQIADAIKRLYTFYGTDTYKWIANLYDPENGGFYYSNSARDYEGFLPDIESTTQALWLIADSGLIAGKGALADALPADVVSKTLNFALSLFDESDGYFYHPQWGKNINSSRKGRDLNSSIDVIRKMGGKVPENTALDRLGNTSAQSAILKFVNSTVAKVGYLDSEAELLAWLEGLNINTDSHSAGHTIESVSSQIKAKGYSRLVLDWLDSKQLETGLWQPLTPEKQYTALSGLLKIGSTYSKLGGYMKRCDKMVETAINVILSDADPYIVIYVYNPWGGLEYALSSMNSANKMGSASYDLDAAYAFVYEKFSDMINATISKLAKFQKADGSFSYYQTASAAYTQGTFVSLGYDEGDVNGTSLGLTTVRKTVFGILGMTPIPMYNGEHYKDFYETLAALNPMKKLPTPDLSANFENGETPPSITTYSTGNASSVEISDIVDKEGSGGKALHILSPSGYGDGVTFNPKLSSDGMSVFTFDFDVMIKSGNEYSHQISLLDPTGSIAYMFTVHVYGNTVAFKDTTSPNHQANAKDWGVTAKVGEWIHIRLEYHVDTEGKVRIYAYINGQCNTYSENFFGRYASNGSENANVHPKTAIERLQIYSMMRSEGDYYLDNISAEFLAGSSAE